jgi:hypothetical protein
MADDCMDAGGRAKQEARAETAALLADEVFPDVPLLAAGLRAAIGHITGSSANLTQGVQFLTQVDRKSEILTRAFFLRIKILIYPISRVYFRFGGNISEIRRGYPRAI